MLLFVSVVGTMETIILLSLLSFLTFRKKEHFAVFSVYLLSSNLKKSDVSHSKCYIFIISNIFLYFVGLVLLFSFDLEIKIEEM